MFTTLSLRLRIFLFFAFLACATSGLAIAGLTLGYFRLGEEHALSAFVIAGVIAILAIFALTTWVWVLFDENVAKPVERLASEMRARAHADVDEEIDHAPAKYLGDLGTAAAAVTSNLTETRNAMALAVGRETARLSAEKTRLETLLSEVPDGVLFCTPWHAIALYNGHARDILGGSEALGLNRPCAASCAWRRSRRPMSGWWPRNTRPTMMAARMSSSPPATARGCWRRVCGSCGWKGRRRSVPATS
jgi:DNA polymerase-3 subunit epsilon